MPRGASAKREREYEGLKKDFEKEGRYKGREEEVAARIVNKQRARFGETKEAKAKEKQGKSPDRGLPIEGYQHSTINRIAGKLGSLSKDQVKKIKAYEAKHKDRKTLMEQLDRKLKIK